MSRIFYDDNYGVYDIRDQDDIDFYFETQRNSVWKTCERCGRRVKIRRDYAICNSCADAIEKGLDY
jgi:hypothetical protein